jgi:hypothetical protein
MPAADIQTTTKATVETVAEPTPEVAPVVAADPFDATLVALAPAAVAWVRAAHTTPEDCEFAIVLRRVLEDHGYAV